MSFFFLSSLLLYFDGAVYSLRWWCEIIIFVAMKLLARKRGTEKFFASERRTKVYLTSVVWFVFVFKRVGSERFHPVALFICIVCVGRPLQPVLYTLHFILKLYIINKENWRPRKGTKFGLAHHRSYISFYYNRLILQLHMRKTHVFGSVLRRNIISV